MGNCVLCGDSTQHLLQYREQLQNIPLLAQLTQDEIIKIAKNLQQSTFSHGEYLMKEGARGKEFFLLTEGSCEVLTEEAGLIAQLNKGDYCGEQALLDKENCIRTASIRATNEGCTCLVMHQKAFSKILTNASNIKFGKRGPRKAVLTQLLEEEVLGEDLVYEKSEKVREWMLKVVHNHILFEDLDRDQKLSCLDVMYKLEVQKRKDIIRQGEFGDKFYLIEKGECDVIVDKKKVAILQRNHGFGEIALLHKTPRNATIRTRKNCVLWCVSRLAFRKAVRARCEHQNKETVAILRKIKNFSALLSDELSMIADALSETTYQKGTKIVKEGAVGNKFYIINKGTARWYKEDGQQGYIHQYGYFGELALMNEEVRRATVVAHSEELVCLELSRNEFNTLLGPLQELMTRSAEKEYGTSKVALNIESSSIVDLSELTHLGVLGKGAFGFVTLVRDSKSKETYALKAIKKQQVAQTKQGNIIKREKDIMLLLDHPRLVRLHKTYKDKYKLYFLMDACLGGELFTILRRKRYFTEKTGRFYSACVSRKCFS